LNCEPAKSITQLPEEEAFALAKKLYDENPCRAHNRFGPDFAEYYPHRLMTEKWLHNKFISLGGNPQTEHPYYFALQHCDNLFQNFNRGKITKIPLNSIDPLDVSFTFGDSVAKMNTPESRDPFLINKLIEYIELGGNDVEKFLDSIKNEYTLIEAQLWTDKYLK
jgi:hypothetical protein